LNAAAEILAIQLQLFIFNEMPDGLSFLRMARWRGTPRDGIRSDT
jgi:hypothetical protein